MDVLLRAVVVTAILAGFAYIYVSAQRYNRRAIEGLFREIAQINLDINFLRNSLMALSSVNSGLKEYVVTNNQMLNVAANLTYYARNLAVYNKPFIMNPLILQAKDIVAEVQDSVNQALREQNQKSA